MIGQACKIASLQRGISISANKDETARKTYRVCRPRVPGGLYLSGRLRNIRSWDDDGTTKAADWDTLPRHEGITMVGTDSGSIVGMDATVLLFRAVAK